MKPFQLIFKKERSTEAYEEPMSIDIENIDTFETRTILSTTKCTPIYEVIDKAYFIGYKNFSDDFIKEFKDDSDEGCDVPVEVKKGLSEWQRKKD